MALVQSLVVSLVTMCSPAALDAGPAVAPTPGLAELQMPASQVPTVRRVTPAQFEGKPAPDFLLSGLDGTQVLLSDLRGRVVLIEFFASWLPASVERLPVLQRLHERYPEGLVVLPITREDNLIVHDFLEQRGIKLPAYVDYDSVAHDSYLVSGPPRTVVVGKDGMVVRYFPGPGKTDELYAALRTAGLKME